MRIALISDIHSNLDALHAVLRDIDGRGVDRRYCLGDVVGYNAYPNECARLVKDRMDGTILGNHDWAATIGEPTGFNLAARAGVEYSRRELGEEEAKFLSSLVPHMRMTLEGGVLEAFHGSPSDPLWQYVFPAGAPGVFNDLARSLDERTPYAIALGHTHVPMLLTAKSVNARGLGDMPHSLVSPNLEASRRRDLVLLNPGSVGQPRDGDPRAAYAVLDSATLAVEFHRVEYDISAAARAIREAGLPDLLAERLFIGR